MAREPGHLIERAAERLRQARNPGQRDTAGLLGALGNPADAFVPPPGFGGSRDATGFEGGPGFGPASATLDRPADARGGPADTGPKPEPDIGREALTRAGMIDWTLGRTRVTEEFRVVQAQVLRGAFSPDLPNGPGNGQGSRSNLVMMTSARPGEGKSFTALNLAVGIARQRDRDVLLVDVDAKADSLGALLGTQGTPGLLDLLADPQREPESLLRTTAVDRLSVLPIGSVGAQRAELASSRQMARVIRDIGRRYSDRLVILDAPPVLSSSEPAALASVVGQVIFVIQAEATQRGEVEAALDMIQSCPSISLLLNKVQLRTRQSFGGYTASYRYNEG